MMSELSRKLEPSSCEKGADEKDLKIKGKEN